jgi:aconitate hydratase A / 2-methylisocitrate dehydratase
MSDAYPDLFGARRSLDTQAGKIDYFALPKLSEQGIGRLEKLPYSIKVLLESVLRNVDDYVVNKDDVSNLASWNATNPANTELPFSPARVVLQDSIWPPCVHPALP